MNKEQERILLDNQIIQNKALAHILTMLESITKTLVTLTEAQIAQAKLLSILAKRGTYHVFL